MSDLLFSAAPLAIVNPITVFQNCDGVGQLITIGLAIASIIAWAVMIGKRNELIALRRLNAVFEHKLRTERRVIEMTDALKQNRAIPYADMVNDAVEAYWRAAAIGKEKGTDNPRFRLEHAENALQRALARQTLRYESSMIFLASIVSGAPFMGLLGTVWGVMTVFTDVSQQQTAGLQAIAPGVSAALLTTIAGLIVAIPSVFGYNLLLAQTKTMITEIENFASSIADRIELESN